MRAAAIPMPTAAPIAVAIHNSRYSRQKSGHAAIGRRVARHAAIIPITAQKTALISRAIGYVLESAIGAPKSNSPGADMTIPINPATALCRPPPNSMMINDTTPIVAGGTRAANGPAKRIRARYQRGPPATGAESTPDSLSGCRAMSASYGHLNDESEHSDDAVADIERVVFRTSWLTLTAAGVWWCALHPHGVHLALVAMLLWLAQPFGRSLGSSDVVVLVAVVGLLVTVAARSQSADGSAAMVVETRYTGSVRVVDDPQPFANSTRLIVEIEDDRCEMWARRYSIRARLASVSAGEYLAVGGRIEPLANDRYERVRWQHVLCEFRIDWVGDVAEGSLASRASNRVRQLVTDVGDDISGERGALFRGLVIGDDRDQPIEMLQRFRSGGLSHLTAVSGQNVALILAAATPLIRKLRPRAQVFTSLLLIGWFVLITRSEPSILRAGVMAAIAVTAASKGRRVDPVRALSIAVVCLLVVDPLLAASVGFHLSVGATFGVIAIGPVIASHLPISTKIAVPIGVTLGAQIGVLLPALLVFQRAPLVSLPANLLAVPVAGVVMMIGMPVAIVVALIPWTARVLLPPVELGVWWVDAVARLAEWCEPVSPWPGIVVSLLTAGWAVALMVSREIASLRARHKD